MLSSSRRLFASAIFAATVSSVLPAARGAEAELRVDAPLPHQIFQRRTAEGGTILVRGQAPAGATGVRARIDEQPWQTLTLAGEDAQFRGELQAPAEKWFAVEIQALENEKSLATRRITPVAVGEVFVIAGQSNSTNYGQVKLTPRSDRVAAFDGAAWRPAHDPQPGAFDRSQQGSCWPEFADRLVDRFDVPIGLVVTGAGGTSVNQWRPRGDRFVVKPSGRGGFAAAGTEYEATGEIFDHFVGRLRTLGPHGFRAVLWHQGESDSNQLNPTPRRLTGEEYAETLRRIIEQSRKESGWDAPWFTAQATFNNALVDGTHTSAVIRAAQQKLWDDGVTLRGPDTDPLVRGYRRGVHFNEQGQRACGAAWADCVVSWLEAQLKAE